MKVRVTSVLLIGLFLIGCGSSQSVYQLPDSQQKGLTYQTYQEAPSEAFDAVSEVLENYNSDMLMQDGWEITSSDKQAGTIQTGWREAGGSKSVSGGKTMGSDSDERYKLNVKITETGSGSKVSMELTKQVRMQNWQTFKVKKKTAQNHLQPLIKELNNELTMQ